MTRSQPPLAPPFMPSSGQARRPPPQTTSRHARRAEFSANSTRFSIVARTIAPLRRVGTRAFLRKGGFEEPVPCQRDQRQEQAAIDLLRLCEGDVAKGVPVTAKIGRLRFEKAVAEVVTDHRINASRSLDGIERRIRLHGQRSGPSCGGRDAGPARDRNKRGDHRGRGLITRVRRPCKLILWVPGWDRTRTARRHCDVGCALNVLFWIRSAGVRVDLRGSPGVARPAR